MGKKIIVATSATPIMTAIYCKLAIFTLVVIMPSANEELEGYKWEKVELRSATDF